MPILIFLTCSHFLHQSYEGEMDTSVKFIPKFSRLSHKGFEGGRNESLFEMEVKLGVFVEVCITKHAILGLEEGLEVVVGYLEGEVGFKFPNRNKSLCFLHFLD